jgi:hypothetical protein
MQKKKLNIRFAIFLYLLVFLFPSFVLSIHHHQPERNSGITHSGPGFQDKTDQCRICQFEFLPLVISGEEPLRFVSYSSSTFINPLLSEVIVPDVTGIQRRGPPLSILS